MAVDIKVSEQNIDLNSYGIDERVEVVGTISPTVTVPDIDWVTIPAGEFVYGEEDEPCRPVFRRVSLRPAVLMRLMERASLLMT